MKNFKRIKAIAAAALSIAMIGAMPVMSVSADTPDSSSIFAANTFNGKVTKTNSNALTIEPDASAGLGSSIYVECSNAQSFTVGDRVTVTYSAAVEENGGTRTVKADSVTAESGGNLLISEPEPTPAPAPVVDTPVVTEPVKETPKTGDVGVVGFASVAVISGLVCGIYTSKKKKSEE